MPLRTENPPLIGGFFYARVKLLSRPLVTSIFMRRNFVTLA